MIKMTLYDLAFRNVKRNFKQYFLYFLSMIVSIVVFFVFRSIATHSELFAIAAQEPRKIKGMFVASSVLLILFISVFVIYSNSFFMKKRKQEIGLYSLLGITKKQIAKMLFYENFIMGFLALFVGMIIGIFLSKYSLLLLLQLMNMDVSLSFELSGDAVWKTTLFFLFIILYTSFQAYLLIYRFKIVELLYGAKKGEKAPKTSWFFALVSLVFLSVGYYLAYYFLEYKLQAEIFLGSFLYLPLFILLTTIAGTYIFFHFFTVFVLQFLRKKRTILYNGMNVVNVSQLLYRIKGNATSLATIATLCAVTICVLGASVSVYFNVEDTERQFHPYSYTYKVGSEKNEKQIDNVLQKYQQKHKVLQDIKIETVLTEGNIHEKEETVGLENGWEMSIISQDTFQKLAKTFHYDGTLSLKKNEVIQLVPKTEEKGEEKKKYAVTFYKNKTVSTLDIIQSKKYPIQNGYTETIVVSNELYHQLKQKGKVETIRIMNVSKDKKAKELTEEMKKYIEVNDFYSGYHDGIGITGVMIFIGFFLGLVFLLATGSIIYFKQVAEAEEDKKQYEMLQKVGATRKEIKRGIQKQIAFYFFIPLILSLLHSFFALNTAKYIFMIIDVRPIFWSAILYILVYIGYYVMTVHSYVKIIIKNKI